MAGRTDLGGRHLDARKQEFGGRCDLMLGESVRGGFELEG